mgnify:CR=1 FL=1
MTERDVVDDRLFKLWIFKHRAGHRRVDESWRDGIDADAVGGQLDTQRFGQTFDRVFGRALERAVGCADMAHL